MKKIAPHNPQIPETRESTTDFNRLILTEYLSRYKPADYAGQGVHVVTTTDIMVDLADMADLTQEDVNAVMASLGYRPGHNSSGSFGWLLLPEAD